MTFPFPATATFAAFDPYWSSVVALVGMAGSNGSTTFTDESLSARTVTTNGNAQVSSAQTLFNNNTGLYDGTGDYLTMADATALSVGNTTDKTIEIWFRCTTVGRINTLWNKRPASNAGEFNFAVNSTNKIIFNAFNSSTAVCQINGATTIAANTWYHAAVVRTTGGVWTLWLDGANDGTATESATPVGSSAVLRIGRDGFNSTRDFLGHLAEARYTNAARYTSAFTRPTTTFPRAG